jgi:probable FeS assembly SUF system protein SufT
MNEPASINLSRDVAATQIPSGIKITIPQGTEVAITQSLGGSFTVVFSGGMARIDEKDAEALGQAAPTAVSETNATNEPLSEKVVYDQLRKVFDPEIPVNVVDLGLIYDVSIQPQDGGQHAVEVKMTLTAPGCGMGPTIAADARSRILGIPNVADANVELVWDPPWNQGMISEVGKMQLGLI